MQIICYMQRCFLLQLETEATTTFFATTTAVTITAAAVNAATDSIATTAVVASIAGAAAEAAGAGPSTAKAPACRSHCSDLVRRRHATSVSRRRQLLSPASASPLQWRTPAAHGQGPPLSAPPPAGVVWRCGVGGAPPAGCWSVSSGGDSWGWSEG